MNNKVVSFIIFAIIGLSAFLVVHFFFISVMKDISQESEKLRIKQIIYSDIIYKIIKIKSSFYQIPLLASNNKILNSYISELKKDIKTTKILIRTLKNGGYYNKSIPLNIPNKNNYTKSFYIKKTSFSILAIDLYPKLEFLDKEVDILKNLTNKIFYLQPDKQSIATLRKDITKFTKSLDSIFRRMLENSNRLFYKNQLELISLNKKIKEKENFYKNIEFLIIFLLIISFILGGYFIIEKLDSLNKDLKRRLYNDNLTGIGSRISLEEIIFNDNSLLILIDIDGFSDINGLYGLDIGNLVLKEISSKLKKYEDIFGLYRVGGDIFGLYMKNYKIIKNNSIENIILNIEKSLEADMIKIDEFSIAITITIGAAIGKNCFHNALAALDIANEERLSYKIFDDDKTFKQTIQFNKTWQKELKYAIEEDRVIPFFQPIVDKNGKIVKYESLMRLKKEDDIGKISYIKPFYIDISIKTKQYLKLSQIIISKTFEIFKNRGEFSINLNYIDIKNKSMTIFLEDLITKYNAAERVTFEILESESIEDYEKMREFLKHFKFLGVKIAIDDFGSGYSNLKRVIDLNPDYIKIDGSLIKNIAVDDTSYIIVKSIVNYSMELGIKTIAEYVHDKQSFKICKFLGIDYFQGFYFSEPKQNLF